MTSVIDILTEDEQARRLRLEAIIETHLDSFIRVAIALAEIKRDQLWRSTHRSFTAYCEEKLGKHKAHAYALASAGEVISNLSDTSEELPLPVAYRQTKPLQKLEPAQQQAAWKAAIATSPDRQPTERQVERAARAVQSSQTLPIIQPGQAMPVLAGSYVGQVVTVINVDGVVVEAETRTGEQIALLTTELVEPTFSPSPPRLNRTGQASDFLAELETRLKIENARAEMLENMLRKALEYLPASLKLEALQLL